ncbi:hypothetical protein [Massilia sp. ST3]|uniref:hypothetical protein n=1 Tax=Massilia sp. ST3 TaxID=2824903 RepID=UPI001B827BDB|nr:hypothetical protein [Massilia sp. ST3]MBQ5947003.1 hypothetical protein [Massilia sp. ST3]
MKRLAVMCLSMLALARPGQAQPPVPALPGAAEIRAAARSPALEQALRAALAENAGAPDEKPKANFGSDAPTAFARQFSEAKLPNCLHEDGLKRQPTFFLSGYLALPFILVAGARGRCQF